MPGKSDNSLGNLSYHFMLTVPVSTASVGANTTAERTFTVPGLVAGYDAPVVIKPSHQTGLGIVNARVSANDTLAITYMNNTGGGITPTTETYILVVARHNYPNLASVPTAFV